MVKKSLRQRLIDYADLSGAVVCLKCDTLNCKGHICWCCGDDDAISIPFSDYMEEI